MASGNNIIYLYTTLKKYIFAICTLAPSLAFAQTAQSVLASIYEMLTMLIPIMMSFALFAFFWGLAKFIWNSGSAEARSQGKSIMISGVAALFVMTSIWGIVALLQRSIGIGPTDAPPVPKACQGGDCKGLMPRM